MHRKIAIGVITYKADKATLERLLLALNSGFSVYLYDNSPEDKRIRSFAERNIDVQYYTCGKNAGLGYGLSTLCAQAYADNVSALLFFDQDTIFSVETLEFIEKFYVQRSKLVNTYSSFFFNSKAKRGNEEEPYGVFNIDLTINSGSLYVLNNLKSIGWHDVSYFVDGVDYKFCLDSKAAGFKIGECTYTPGFDHVSEQADKRYALLSREYYLRSYPRFRIADTTKSNLRLSLTALRRKEWRLSYRIIRMLCIYLAGQCVVRVINSKG